MIRILTTGGTIEGLDDDLGIHSSPDDFIKHLLEPTKIGAVYTIEQVFSKDSRHLTNEDRQILGEKIQACNEKKVLITHGTLSMVDTAVFLGKLGLEKCIVLVGSFVLGTKAGNDAQFNLGYALAALNYLPNGVYIAMQGQVFDWNNVRKNKELNRFEKLNP